MTMLDKMIYSVIFAVLTFLVAAMNATAENEASTTRAVLITGASSGIGKRTAELLSKNGHFVYAGARKQKDLDALNTMKNVEAVRLDVTVPKDIDNAVQQITKAGRGLYGVVNNAGVVIVAPLIEVEESDLNFQFDVNIYGPYRVTRAFAPMLMESKGRVVNISSISGILSAPLMGGYSMSKHALEAYTDSLAKEMDKFGVKVIAVEPGNYASKIGESAKQRFLTLGRTPEGSLFEKQMSSALSRAGERTTMADPIAVAEAVEHALFSESPKARYMVVPNQREAEITIRKAIQEMVELNHDQNYSYDRDALVKMIDEAMQALQ